jgi:hypothetical protein
MDISWTKRVSKGELARRASGAILCFIAAMLLFTDSSLSAVSKGFCRPGQVVRDYLKPLAELPPQRSPLLSGKLRGGPPSLRIYPPRSNLVASGRDRFELVGSVEGASESSRRLDWIVKSRLEKVSRTGAHSDLIRSRKQNVPTLASFEDLKFGFGSKGARGLYRLTYELRNRGGKMIDRVAEYFRAVEAHSDMRLASIRREVAPGEAVNLRVENLGTMDGAFNYLVRLYDEVGEEVPVEQGVFPAIRPVVRPGHVGSCFSFRVPSGTVVGGYRVGVRVWDRVLRRGRIVFSSIVVKELVRR